MSGRSVPGDPDFRSLKPLCYKLSRLTWIPLYRQQTATALIDHITKAILSSMRHEMSECRKIGTIQEERRYGYCNRAGDPLDMCRDNRMGSLLQARGYRSCSARGHVPSTQGLCTW